MNPSGVAEAGVPLLGGCPPPLRLMPSHPLRRRVYQPGLVTPPNLYLAQLARRRQLAAQQQHHQAGAAAAADSLEEGPAMEPAPAPEPAAQWAIDAAAAPATV